MRARNIKPGFFKNDKLTDLGFAERLLFAGLWCMADREGRMLCRAKVIKGEIFPHDPVDVPAMLDALEENGFIRRYKPEEDVIIQVVNFSKHQNPHKHEAASVLPAEVPSMSCHVPDKHSTCTVQAQDMHSTCPADSLIPDSLIPIRTPSAKASVLPEGLQEQASLMVSAWPKVNSKGETMPRASVTRTVEAMSALVRRGKSLEGLCGAAKKYLEDFHTNNRPVLKAPQFFFGPRGYWADLYE